MKTRQHKIEKLKGILTKMGSVLMAFSGGVDSSLLLAAAVLALSEKVVGAAAVAP